MEKHYLKTYFDILFYNTIEDYTSKFHINQTLNNYGYMYAEEHHCYIKEVMVISGGNQSFFTDLIDTTNFIPKLLKLVNNEFYNHLEKVILSNSKNSNKELLNTVYSNIYILLKKVNKSENKNAKFIEDKLQEIIENLRDRYNSIVDYHIVYKYLIKESDLNYFKNKDLKYRFYQDLYKLASDLYLIDDIEIEEDTFINAFISPKPQTLNNKLRFITKNNITAYFLKSIKPFFNGLTYEAIEKSQVVLNKQNKNIKVTDINTALSRGKNKDKNEKSKIDIRIAELVFHYLN